MNAEIQGYAGFIDELLAKAAERAAPLDRETLNWRPLDSDTNSVAALCAHMCGVVRWWVVQGLTGRDVGRLRDTEFTAEVDAQGRIGFWGVPRTIDDVVTETRVQAAEVLGALEPSALEELSACETLGPQTNRWALVHTIDELSQHIGHLELTLQLREAGV